MGVGFMKYDFEMETVKFEDSAMGKQLNELSKLRQDFDNYVREQEPNRKAEDERRRIDRKRNIMISIVSGSISGIISGIVLYYWPAIMALIQ